MCQKCRSRARINNRHYTIELLSNPDFKLTRLEKARVIKNHLMYEFYSKMSQIIDVRGSATVDRLSVDQATFNLRTDPEYQDL